MKKKVSLGKAPLLSMEAELKNLAAELRGSLPNRISEEVGEVAAAAVSQNLASIANLDGNAAGAVTINRMGPIVRVSNFGAQVAYLEFGTGAAGQSGGTSAAAAEAGYVHSNKRQWVYWNKLRGKFATSHGLPPQNQVLHAAGTARRSAPAIAKAEIRRVVSKV